MSKRLTKVQFEMFEIWKAEGLVPAHQTAEDWFSEQEARAREVQASVSKETFPTN